MDQSAGFASLTNMADVTDPVTFTVWSDYL